MSIRLTMVDMTTDRGATRKRRVAEYFHMWVSRDFRHFDGIFARNCRYEECTGAIYEGSEELHRWIHVMLNQQRVSAWAIHEFIEAADDQIVVTWTFEATESSSYIFDGVSLIHFNEQGLIDHVREYQAEHEKIYPQRQSR